ncbi:MAG TPA: STAS domain-containing protein [Nitrospira sp.]|nr:STAS domain-containing protein [Nitrospira sp.]
MNAQRRRREAGVIADMILHDNCSLVSLRGALRYQDRAELVAAVDRSLDAGCARVVLDLRHVHFIDSVALGLLALTYRRLESCQREFGLLMPTEQVSKLLMISGIPKIVPIYHSEREAIGCTVP